MRPEVLGGLGGFGALFEISKKYKNPVLVSGTDGVGTKLKLAFMSNRHNTIGEDIVNHCVNDILVHGAKPLFFLDYIATGKLKPETVVSIIEGIARGCQKAGMALIGGETAEMPDFYQPGEYDLAGFIVGIVEQDKIINGERIAEGDILIGLASNGLHTNGYSLARKSVFDVAGMKFDDYVESVGMSIGAALLVTHKSYLYPVGRLLDEYNIKGMAHITGGGIAGNLIRILPENMRAVIRKKAWVVPTIFQFIRQAGSIHDSAMYQAFNMGIGYILVVSEKDAVRISDSLKALGETPYIIGEIERGKRDVVLREA